MGGTVETQRPLHQMPDAFLPNGSVLSVNCEVMGVEILNVEESMEIP